MEEERRGENGTNDQSSVGGSIGQRTIVLQVESIESVVFEVPRTEVFQQRFIMKISYGVALFIQDIWYCNILYLSRDAHIDKPLCSTTHIRAEYNKPLRYCQGFQMKLP